MKIAFLFPGQGSQTLGMGKDLYEEFESYKKIYEDVKNITGIDILKITFEDEEKLNQTKYTQLAILVESLAILKVLEEKGIDKSLVNISCGLSLGEYTSLIYSNVFSFNDGIDLVKSRGEFMQDMLPKGNWKMAAVMGLSDDEVIEACKKVTGGFVKPVNFNYEGQVAISGDSLGVDNASQILKEMGAKKVRELNTSGPFHTEKLIESSKALRSKLDKVNINNKAFNEVTVYKNIDGEKYDSNDDVKDILANHIVNPVRFSKIINNLINVGVDTFIEIGPGKTLSGFIKRTNTDKKLNILNINDLNSLNETVKFINENR